LGRYRERDRFGAWLLRVVVNQCRTQAAKQRRWSAALEVSATALVAHSDGEALAEAALRSEKLAQALAQLGAEQREAVVLRFADELSYEEMATITGVGVSALKMRVQRACARLRALLSEHFHA
jgi:RNA polymerase sigma-70 factor (ECF subfamily)